MSLKVFAVAAMAGLAVVAAPHTADAGPRKERRTERLVERDCKPVNGPFGYYGNPWCDGGFKQAEDYAPGEGGYFDVFDLPRFRRLDRWLD